MDKEQVALERIRAASEMSLLYYKKPLLITNSGGKDSSVCLALAKRAGVPYEVLHNHTTVDAPETVRFIREQFADLENLGITCSIEYPHYNGKPASMWNLIPQRMVPPTRLMRYCCSVLKERGGRGRFITTGVRWAESKRRADTRGIYETVPSDFKKKIILNNDNDDRRRLFETCTLKSKRACNPIIDWTDRDVWDYIRAEHIPVNPLYDCGYTRVGCVGCPMAGRRSRQREFAMYPKFQAAYIRAFDRMLARLRSQGKGKGTWGADASGMDVFHWWMEDGVLQGQMEIDEDEWMNDEE